MVILYAFNEEIGYEITGSDFGDMGTYIVM
jgi:hypothetical protein